MPETHPAVEVALRIPGIWSHPKELIASLPPGCRLTPEFLQLADGTKVEFNPLPPDEQFAEIFRTSCRRPPTADEMERVGNYTVNVCLSGPGGSSQAAQKMMDAGAAIIRAGGAGVFIDNCGLAHGGENWLYMTEDGSSDAISFAFVAITRSESEVWTMGMHVLGMRDILMQRSDVEQGGFDIVEVVRYLARGDKPIADGHIIADESGPQFQAFAADSPAQTAGSAMHNPFGRLKLVSVKDIAGRN